MRHDTQAVPQVEIDGSIGYVSQHPWILNTTVKQNVTLDEVFNPQRYQDAIKYSCLESDLRILIKRDETEIGEKGVNLSGGQKARVSLARSLYKDCDIYLLDDPLSAVDAHVGSFILRECIKGYLKHKTRVLVTHNTESLKHVDFIYIMKRGSIVGSGRYEDLKDTALFHEIEEHAKKTENEEEEKGAEQAEDATFKSTVVELEAETLAQNGELSQPEITKFQAKEERSDQTEPSNNVKDDLNDKLMLDEDKEVGTVSLEVFESFIKYYGGLCYMIFLCLVVIIWVTMLIGSSFWLSYWSDDVDEIHFSKKTYFIIYSSLGMGQVFFSLFRSILIYIQALKCARIVHQDMIARILRAPINLFFDRVPIGRLLNRLSQDLTVIDSSLAPAWNWWLGMAFLLIGDLVVCIIVGSLWVLPVVVMVFLLSLQIQRRFTKINREAVRLRSISKSPIVSFFSESLNGITSIRAYQEEVKFADKFHHLQNAYIKNLILVAGLTNWLSLRITLSSILVVTPTLAIPLLVNTNNLISPGMIGILCSYVIILSDDIIGFLWSLSFFESSLVSLERCKAFTEITPEAPARTVDTSSIEGFSST